MCSTCTHVTCNRVTKVEICDFDIVILLSNGIRFRQRIAQVGHSVSRRYEKMTHISSLCHMKAISSLLSKTNFTLVHVCSFNSESCLDKRASVFSHMVYRKQPCLWNVHLPGYRNPSRFCYFSLEGIGLRKFYFNACFVVGLTLVNRNSKSLAVNLKNSFHLDWIQL